MRRWARTHGPFEGARAARPLRARPDAGAGRRSSAPASWCAASCGPAAPSASGATPRCCGGCGARRSPRCGRRSSRPTSARSRASCRAGRASTATRRPAPGSTGCARCSCRCRASRCPPRCGSATCCRAASAPTRRRGSTSCARRARSSGSAPAPLGRRTGKVALYFRDDAAVLGPPPGARGDSAEQFAERAHDAIRARLRAGRLLLHRPARRRRRDRREELQEALWDLVWAGEVTNDAFAPLRSPRALSAGCGQQARAERAARRRRFGTRRAGAQPQVQGRWSLTAPLFAGGADDPAGRRRAQAELLLERYGIVTREHVLAEGIPGGFSSLYDSFGALETLGVCQRGYFVEGLGGAQFALPGAAERLRAQRDDDAAPPVVLAATDPAQPYGARAAVADARRRARPSRAGGRLRRAGRRRAGALRRARRQGPAGARRGGRRAARRPRSRR